MQVNLYYVEHIRNYMEHSRAVNIQQAGKLARS